MLKGDSHPFFRDGLAFACATGFALFAVVFFPAAGFAFVLRTVVFLGPVFALTLAMISLLVILVYRKMPSRAKVTVTFFDLILIPLRLYQHFAFHAELGKY